MNQGEMRRSGRSFFFAFLYHVIQILQYKRLFHSDFVQNLKSHSDFTVQNNAIHSDFMQSVILQMRLK